MEHQIKIDSDEEKRAWLQERLKTNEIKLMTLTKQLLTEKQVFKKKREDMEHKINKVKTENDVLVMQDEVVRKRACTETENLQRISDLRSEDIVDRFRKQAVRVTEKLKRAKEDHASLQNMFDSRVRDLERTLDRCIERKKTLEKNEDADRMYIDLLHLKRRAREIQENVGNLTKEEGEDCLEELNKEIEYVKRQVIETDKQLSTKKKDHTFGYN